ncbi:MAG TPA: alcohol dehydrogenase catalytic domain-containing protein [Spirochaetia bacterium]|nr:alcohol dehydrogenase catalytic domain-containing protein [Spirochaetia bacterium]HTZ50176.1 alcohol dehydrogenase catalytic domain-containing protein [Spirochaetia bacterium]
MTAAVLQALNTLQVKDVPEPVCGEGEAVLEVDACAVCGSDIRIFHYGNDRVKPPAVIGHEIAGRIVKIGRGVTRVKEGQRIALGADVPCGTCTWCTTDRGTNCAINYAIGYQFPGGFQQRMLLNATTLNYGPVTPIPEGLAYAEAAIAEPLACALNGLELARFGIGKSICIIGLGPIGCMMLELSRVFGASRVFAAQRSRARLDMARQFLPEARFIATEEEDLVDTVMKETGGQGVDLAITTAGSVQAHEDAIRMVAHRGYVNLFGGLKNQPKLSFDSNLIHYKECFVMGSHGSLPRHHRVAVDLIARGAVQAKKYVSAVFPLEKTADAFAYHESRAGLKVVVAPHGEKAAWS